MKETLIIFVAVILIVCFCVWMDSDPGHHKYKIKYLGYKGMSSYDYTDEVKEIGNHIEYTDHRGHKVERFGTFEVINQ
jgi:hypothetical protein